MESYIVDLIEKRKNRELADIFSKQGSEVRLKTCRNLNLFERAVNFENIDAMTQLLRGANGCIANSDTDRLKLGSFLFLCMGSSDRIIF